ncbi:hypothetical protein JRO89_XS15G0114400 [Xanthoceras sorbifolium]|uniref:Proton pump-interactor 1 n=1 Tax=Xanthoceras sorbifolium TaxID=99658 RepID=A0ABQ8H1N7_9ROSI|nr:hypothetical protein JRO89_XS15G0114400 [Xanthoceras sorbifolium]
MGVEVAEMAQVPVETVTKNEMENGKLDHEPVKFGSHGDEPVKGEDNNVSTVHLPKDAVDEWPAPVQIHSFYFVKYRPYDDPKIKAKLDQADREIQRRNTDRFELLEELKAKKSERAEIIAQLRTIRSEVFHFKSIADEKKKEMEPLQQALGKLRTTNSAGRSGGICSSEEELNDLIHSLTYRIQHESIPLSEEKQLLREIKQLEGTREKVMANAAMRAKIQDSLGQKEVIQGQVKLMGVDLDGVKKDQQAAWTKVSNLDAKIKALEKEIKTLQDEVQAVTDKRDKVYESIKELRKQRDAENAFFYEYRKILNTAKDLAVKKNIKALEEYAEIEVEKFMTLWSSNKAVRDDYEKRILPSLDARQLSKDGRIRNPDERPLVVVEAPVPSEPETLAKANVKRPKEDSKSSPQQDTLPTQKGQKESTKKAKDSKSAVEHSDIADKEISVSGKPAIEPKVDEAKLKEMKREEEIAKAKLAMERKKKLAEKAAAKAAIRAQKEAEKKLKEIIYTFLSKKKAGFSTNEESPEAVTETEETEKADVNDEAPVEAPIPTKPRVHKDTTIKHRPRSRGAESLPKAILKRKKSTNYWLWAGPAALAVVLILALVYYYYLLFETLMDADDFGDLE